MRGLGDQQGCDMTFEFRGVIGSSQLHELSCTALESFQSSSLLTPKMSINGLQVEASCQVVVYGVGYSFRKLIVQAGTQVFRVLRLVV